jgi:hypothetical protein
MVDVGHMVDVGSNHMVDASHMVDVGRERSYG